jgi:hypothetical protein
MIGDSTLSVKMMWVLKKSVIGTCVLAGSVAADEFSFLTRLIGGQHKRGYWLAQEAHQPFDVLRSRRQQELLTYEL